MLQPLHDHVVLEVIKQETTTKSGIVLQSGDAEKQPIGKVIAVGKGRYVDGEYQPMHVAVGDNVLYKEYSTTTITMEGKEYLLIKESDLLAIVKE